MESIDREVSRDPGKVGTCVLADLYRPIEVAPPATAEGIGHSGRDNPRTYSLRTLMLIVTWLAVCLRITTEAPAIAVLGLFIFSLAMARTISDLNLARDGVAGASIRQSIVAYLNSICIVIGSLTTGLAMFVALLIAALAVAHGGPSLQRELFAGCFGLLSFLSGPAVAIYFLTKTWPRSGGPWRSVVRVERWYDHRTGMALPLPPWKLGDDAPDGPTTSSESDRVAGPCLVAGHASRA